MKTWVAVIFLVLIDSAGNLFISRGMKQVGEVATLQPQELLRLGSRALMTPIIWLGILCAAITFFLFLNLLSWADLSFVQPATALGYPLNVLNAQYILKENVTPVRWLGTVFICIGVALVSLSSSAN